MTKRDQKNSPDKPRPPLRHGEQLARGFFGRRSGKTLTERQHALMGEYLQQLKIDIMIAPPLSLGELFAADVGKIWMESGFGGGEHLVHRAQENPHIGYIGVEPFRNGMAKALVAIDAAAVSNVRVFDEEAGLLLDWLPDSSLDGFYLLYPDPWPKTRHFKRRFVNRANLDRIARVLKPGAEFRVASDIDSYVEWTLEHLREHKAFRWRDGVLEKALEPWENWPGTRYEAKALRAGRVARYLTFERTDHGRSS